MIVVKIEMWPHGDEAKSRPLGRIEIANDSSGDQRTGHYNGKLHAEYTDENGRKGRVTNFKRSDQSVWSLVGAFLKLWGHTKHSPKYLEKK